MKVSVIEPVSQLYTASLIKKEMFSAMLLPSCGYVCLWPKLKRFKKPAICLLQEEQIGRIYVL